MTKARTIRCAIYTRKSSEEGLEQEFNSLDAQREAAEAYIKSQAHEGVFLISLTSAGAVPPRRVRERRRRSTDVPGEADPRRRSVSGGRWG